MIMNIIFFSGWVESSSVKPYEDFKDKHASKSTKAFKAAVEKIEEYIVKKGVRRSRENYLITMSF